MKPIGRFRRAAVWRRGACSCQPESLPPLCTERRLAALLAGMPLRVLRLACQHSMSLFGRSYKQKSKYYWLICHLRKILCNKPKEIGKKRSRTDSTAFGLVVRQAVYSTKLTLRGYYFGIYRYTHAFNISHILC